MLDEASPVARFLGVVDLFVVWWIVVLAIGMSVLYRRPTRSLALASSAPTSSLALLCGAGDGGRREERRDADARG